MTDPLDANLERLRRALSVKKAGDQLRSVTTNKVPDTSIGEQKPTGAEKAMEPTGTAPEAQAVISIREGNEQQTDAALPRPISLIRRIFGWWPR